jgi:parallel beta-helix repeat protein
MNKRAKSAALMVFLFSALAGLQFISVAEANIMPPPPPTVKVYIKSDGSVEPSTTPIQRLGNVYVFTDNLLNHTIEVQRSNIIVDGNGFTLKGVGVNAGITLQGRRNVTIKNVNFRNYVMSVWLKQSLNNIVANNTMLTAFNVILDSSSYNQIVGNNITGQDTGYGYGVQVNSGSTHTTVVGNNFYDAGIGVRVQDADHTTVTENHFKRGGASVLTHSNYNTISNNSMIDGKDGVAITGSGSHNTVFGNHIEGKSQIAIQIYKGFNNTICENFLENNAVGVMLGIEYDDLSGFEPENNHFYRNNFVNNTQEVIMGYHPDLNFWDRAGEGNYWSNYNGTDNDEDGIGDTPYIIDEKNKDNYPRMNPVEITAVPEFPSWASLLVVLIVVMVAVVIYRNVLNKPVEGEKYL